jgi:hypothetical protein
LHVVTLALGIAATIIQGRELKHAAGIRIASISGGARVVVVARPLRIDARPGAGVAGVDHALIVVAAIDRSRLLDARSALEFVADVDAVAEVPVVADLWSVDAKVLGHGVVAGGIAGINGTIPCIPAIRNGIIHGVAGVGRRVALLYAVARIFVVTMKVFRAPLLLLILPPQGLVAQLLVCAGVRPSRKDASLRQQLVRGPGVDEAPAVVLVPSLGVAGIAQGRLFGAVDHGVPDLIVRALREVRDEEGGDSSDVGSGHGGTGELLVGVTRHGGQDVASRSRNLDLIVPRAEAAQLSRTVLS